MRDVRGGVDRRAFLKVAGSGLTAALGGSAASAASRLPIQSVEEIALQVVVDAATFGPFLPDRNLPGLRLDRATRREMPRMPRTTLMAEFGLSILATSKRGSDKRQVLVDLGYSPDVLSNNIALLGIDPAEIDAVVLSHGHLDHYGGFTGLFSADVARGRAVPLIAGGEEAFCERIAAIGDPPPVMGRPDRADLARAGFQTRIAASPIVVADHAFTTGVIPLVTFERAAVPTQMRPGIGCVPTDISPAKRSAAQLPDDGEHELATCYILKGRGLVVIASCSHRGVLNSVRQAQVISGISKVHAVVGGFHLVRPRTEDEARRTVAEFAQIDPTYIVPMHCTGEAFIAEAMRRMPEKVIRPYVGHTFVFTAA